MEKVTELCYVRKYAVSYTHLLRDSHEINYIFNKIYDEFIIKDEKEDYHCANLLKIFIFEIFQFGKEWGTFDIKHINHDSILSKNILIDNSNNQNVFLCSYLNNENLIKLSNLVEDVYKRQRVASSLAQL